MTGGGRFKGGAFIEELPDDGECFDLGRKGGLTKPLPLLTKPLPLLTKPLPESTN